MAYSFKSVVDGGSDADLVYYNCTLTATKTNSLYLPSITDAQIKFNETRDAPIIKDASQYYFSLIRFGMNGPGKNLPLFIPLIQTNDPLLGPQTDPNLTIYYVSIAYQREWNFTIGGVAQTAILTLTPPSTPLIYVSETQNTTIAPVPTAPVTGIVKQDLSTRYYWVYTYKHFVSLVNATMLEAMNALWGEFTAAWTALGTATPNPYPTLDSFLLDQDVPSLYYDEDAGLFSIIGDTRCFNMAGQLPLPNATQPALPAFVATPYNPGDPASPVSTCYLRLFFNDLLFGLLTNFNNTFFGAVNGGGIPFPLTAGLQPLQALTFPYGAQFFYYGNEILFTSQNFQNLLNNNPLLQNLPTAPPPVYNPQFLLPVNKQNLYWIAKQDYKSTDTIWSPCANIVFTSAMLPIRKEFTAAPVELNRTNVAGKSVPAQSSFEPIIADYIVDQQIENAQGYRSFQLYGDEVEYKMMSLTASHEEIRNIDIQVWWRFRLTGELFPLTMIPGGDCTIKIMFRRIDYRS